MKLKTLGHASMLISSVGGDPVLLTDPWLIGSVYWRSWWLQHYPDAAELERLKDTRYTYLTHEHPDHFHPPSLRLLGKRPELLYPSLPQDNMGPYLTEQGFRPRNVPAGEWFDAGDGLRLLSMPQWNDDSVLVAVTADAVILNFNDAKPLTWNVNILRRWLDTEFPGLRRILLSSYSPASSVNSCFRDNKRLSLRDKSGYIRYVNRICTALAADFFMPFASQAIFRRSDSEWANAFKVTLEDLQAGWTAPTTLLPPYSEIDLSTFAWDAVAPADYRSEYVQAKIDVEQEQDRTQPVQDRHLQAFSAMLRSCRPFTAPLFPKGVGLRLRGKDYSFSTWTGELKETQPHFAIEVPVKAFADGMEFGHFGDLGISMFTNIHVYRNCRPLMVYVFLQIVTLWEYRHLQGIGNGVKWFSRVLRYARWRLPAAS